MVDIMFDIMVCRLCGIYFGSAYSSNSKEWPLSFVVCCCILFILLYIFYHFFYPLYYFDQNANGEIFCCQIKGRCVRQAVSASQTPDIPSLQNACLEGKIISFSMRLCSPLKHLGELKNRSYKIMKPG